MCCDLGDGNYKMWVDESLVKKGAHSVKFESNTYPSCSRPQVSIDIITHGLGYYTYWDINSLQRDVLVYVKRDTYSSKDIYTKTICLPKPGPFEFTVRDVEGDGLCCEFGNGSYKITVDRNSVTSGGLFIWFESTTFYYSTMILSASPSFIGTQLQTYMPLEIFIGK